MLLLDRFSAIAEFHLCRSIYRFFLHLRISVFYTLGFSRILAMMCSEQYAIGVIAGSWDFNHFQESGQLYCRSEASGFSVFCNQKISF